MKIALLLVALLTTACHHQAPVATTPAPHPDRYGLPAEAKPQDFFCVVPSPFELTTSDEAHGLACVSVKDLRDWIRGRRFAQ